MTVNVPHLMVPTPPSSPPPEFRSTINLLDSLVAFYQQEAVWVTRKRASLAVDEAIQVDEDLSPSPSPSSPSPSAIKIKQEPQDVPVVSKVHSSPRWLKRKKGMKLKDAVADRFPVRNVGTLHLDSSDDEDPGVRILEMYDSMVQMRMASCHRINRLIRRANRGDIAGIVRQVQFCLAADRSEANWATVAGV